MRVSTRLDDLARATPATRDRYVDFLRAASIVAVVFGHWFISINHLERDVYSTTSAVGRVRNRTSLCHRTRAGSRRSC